MNHLEKYILENRDEFDRMEDVPEEAMWQNIRQRNASSGEEDSTSQHAEKASRNRWKALAITGFILALAGWGILFFKKQTPVEPAVPALETPIASQEQTQPPVVLPPAAKVEIETKQPLAANKPTKKTATKKTPPPEQPPSELAQQEAHLQQLVHRKKNEIGFERLDRAAFAELFRELDELEITVEQARKDAAELPRNERLAETLIRYYELKIRILEQLSNEINKKEYHEGLEKSI